MSNHDNEYNNLSSDEAANYLLDKIYINSINVASEIDLEVIYHFNLS